MWDELMKVFFFAGLIGVFALCQIAKGLSAPGGVNRYKRGYSLGKSIFSMLK